MPIIKSAIKRVKQAARRNEQNVATKKALKAATKAFMLAPSAAGLSAVQSTLDTAVKKNVLEKNTAARRKAQYARVAKNAGIKAEATTKKTAAAKPAAKKPAAKSAATAVVKKAPAKKPAAKKTTK